MFGKKKKKEEAEMKKRLDEEITRMKKIDSEINEIATESICKWIKTKGG